MNLSLGPRLPIEDDEVHAWTSALEPILADGDTLLTVAVGNDGDQNDKEQARIQVPSDLVNGLAVGATASDDELFWNLASYSCIGPGRSPGLVKPDVVMFGGDRTNPMKIYSPLSNCVSTDAGTSFASPLALRTAIGTKALLQADISPMLSKCLLVHNAQNNGFHWHHVGWGKVTSDIDQILYTEDNEATVIYRDKISAGGYLRALIPVPDIDIKGRFYIKATFCYSTHSNPEHPFHYTSNGLEVIFRPLGEGEPSDSFFTNKEIYPLPEHELRKQAHKWETTLHKEKFYKPHELGAPCFEINHQARDGANKTTEAEPLSFVFVVSIKAENTPQLYDSIVQKYQVLQPLRTKVDVPIRTSR